MNRLALASTIAVAATLTATAQTNTYPFPASGNVGIGTTTPNLPLTVFGGNEIADLRSSAASALLFFSPSLGCHQWRIGAGDVNPNDFGIRDMTAGSTRLSINGSGNVGIGTTSPVSKLTIQGDGSDWDTGQLLIHGASSTTKRLSLGFDTSNNVGFLQALIAGDNYYNFALQPHGGKVGIGTTTPQEQLHVFKSGTGYGWYGRAVFGNESAVALLGVYHDGAIVGAHNGQLNAWGKLYINTDPDLGAGGDVIIRNNVGIGTTNPTHKLAVNGTIKAKEVIVETTGWSDYVFADGYALQPLAEVEAHIKTNKHLPGIPSAAQVAEQGVSLGDMQARLLAKIEELTLHQIAQEKLLRMQTTELNALRSKVASLEQSK